MIKLLAKDVADRIAAGEVVDRPASVIKELVENSLDASSSQITVEIRDGGKTFMCVSDNGCGMNAEDLALSVQRFATSKIKEWEDLESLYTLGFRGEALPSIASVSRLEIRSAIKGAMEGACLKVEGSQPSEIVPCPAITGTKITVRDLFFNTPARLKFLRSSSAESTQIIDLVGRMASAWSEVAFRLISNGKEVFSFTADSGAQFRLAQLWKVPVDSFIPISGQSQGIYLDGFIVKPSFSKSTRNYQLFVMNGRLIRSQNLSQALNEGFAPLVERGRFPMGMLRLTVDPAFVDVNVHPTKMEVRFADPTPVFSLIYHTVNETLEKHKADSVLPKDLEHLFKAKTDISSLYVEPIKNDYIETNEVPVPVFEEKFSEPESIFERKVEEVETVHKEEPREIEVICKEKPKELELIREEEKSEKFQVLGQVYNTFIVGTMEGKLWLVDQHTAHERINYEKFSHIKTLTQRSQGLLIPEFLDISPLVGEFLEENRDVFLEYGYELERFGKDRFALRSVPVALPLERAVKTFRELVEELAQERVSWRENVRETLREKIRAMASCKASVRAGEPLNLSIMSRLVNDMLKVEHSLYCPHGRPTRVVLEKGLLERLFHRS
ncbi:DNA mismatch repair endonuclease MutL [bacterium]|nr:DNA mismatch repair endonuclease MutL [bacterium]